MSKNIKVAVVGVGNCASSLIQGIDFYRTYPEKKSGLIHHTIGGYGAGDIDVVAAFDVDVLKVNQPLHRAIFQSQNNTINWELTNNSKCRVSAAPVMDGLGSTYKEKIDFINESKNIEKYQDILGNSGTEIIINYLPVGSEKATQFWAALAAQTGCAFINTIPVFIARDKKYKKLFKKHNVPLLGDDVKSQIGATILHREIIRLCKMRGVSVDKTYQLNFGGNMDFYNMLASNRLDTKKVSKTNAVFAELESDDEARNFRNTHISPSDFVPWLADRKWAYIRIEGKAFGGAPYAIETKLEVWDSPNSAGVVIDLIRCAKIAMNKGDGGIIPELSGFYFKSPPVDFHDLEALEKLEVYINE